MKPWFSNDVMRAEENLIEVKARQWSFGHLSSKLVVNRGWSKGNQMNEWGRNQNNNSAFGKTPIEANKPHHSQRERETFSQPASLRGSDTYRVGLYIGLIFIFPPFDLVMFFACLDLSLHDLVLDVSLLLSSFLLTDREIEIEREVRWSAEVLRQKKAQKWRQG